MGFKYCKPTYQEYTQIQLVRIEEASYWNTVDFGYSGHGYSGHLDIVATLAGAEYFRIISSLNHLLIVATHFGYSGHFTGSII